MTVFSGNTLRSAWTAVALALGIPAAAGPITHFRACEAKVPLQVIAVDLNDLNVKVTGQLTKYGPGRSEPFSQMVRRSRPTVAVTGTFFDVRSAVPIGDVVIGGRLCHFGGMGTALCITENNEVEFVQPERYVHQDWSRFDFVIACGPRLITNGIVGVYPRTEGFKDRRMLARNGRLAIGVTRGNKLVIVMTRKPVYLSRLAQAMRALGVWNAINLDAGSSMGLHYRGRTIVQPRRWLTNLVVVYEDRNRYEQVQEAMVPIPLRAASR